MKKLITYCLILVSFATKAQELSYPQAIMNVITANPETTVGKSFSAMVTESERTVGVDSYGNVINGSDGAILIPYYQNDFIKGTSLAALVSADGWSFLSHPVLTTAVNSTDAKNLLDSAPNAQPKEGKDLTTKDKEGLSLLFGGEVPTEVSAKLEKAKKAYASAGANETAIASILTGVSGDKEDTLRAIAAIITAKTYTQVVRRIVNYIFLLQMLDSMMVVLRMLRRLSVGQQLV